MNCIIFIVRDACGKNEQTVLTHPNPHVNWCFRIIGKSSTADFIMKGVCFGVVRCITHYDDVIMSAMKSQFTSITIVYSTFLSGRGSKKTSNVRVTGHCAGKSPGTGEFPAEMASNAENVSIWWRHHEIRTFRFLVKCLEYAMDALVNQRFESTPSWKMR